MSVAINNTNTASTLAGTSVSLSHTSSSASDRAILAQAVGASDGISATAVAYGGQALTGPAGAVQDGAIDRGKLRIWSKTGQLTGANNVTFTMSAYGRMFVSVADFSGVDQTTPIGTLVEDFGSGTTPSPGSVTCPANGMIWGGMWGGFVDAAPTISGTGNTIAGTFRDGFGSCKAGGYRSSTGSLQWAISGGTWTAQAVPINAVSGGGDTTAPTLSAAVGTTTGGTTATVGATTDEANGTMYAIVSTSATPPTATQIQAGQQASGTSAPWSGNLAISTAGAKTLNATGLTISTVYYAHTQQKDSAGNNSAVLTSASFTTSSGSDTTPPVETGTVTATSITQTSYTTTCPTATDNVAVTGYEISLDGGGSWIDNGNSTTRNVTGRTPGATDAVRWRAYDAAGNRSTPALALAVTLLTYTVAGDVIKNNAGTVQAGITIPKVAFLRLSDMVNVLTLSNQVTNGSGLMSISNAAFANGVAYLRVLSDATGANVGCKVFTAA